MCCAAGMGFFVIRGHGMGLSATQTFILFFCTCWLLQHTGCHLSESAIIDRQVIVTGRLCLLHAPVSCKVSTVKTVMSLPADGNMMSVMPLPAVCTPSAVSCHRTSACNGHMRRAHPHVAHTEWHAMQHLLVAGSHGQLPTSLCLPDRKSVV